ncbi:hypothetical protein MesoLjLc_57120 [Mesorhizobium sp. L-8-10]|uniref:YbaY family lipoprotein n=1 Tax=Mesorhizobium sp. L-8-10 TaxID=2744523 RepID=UPI001928E8DA|nr:YbaY family lipoprotein [Mesorhizobium sp. L-8-10]BCH33782.1 hypothetical protein MesoLjLc_57120 [Mesorhizobium sp. L-8-10]
MFGKIAEVLVFGFAPLVIAMLATSSASFATEKTISGEVLYRERIALPPNAVLTVQLVDISLAGAPASVVGKQVVDPAGQVPIRFTIVFDPAVIQGKAQYALEAGITVDNSIWFINDIRHSVDPLQAPPQSMVLKMVRQSETPAAPSIFDATWLVDDIEGTALGGEARVTFAVSADGRVSGRGPCNGYFGTAEIHDGTIEIGDIGSTMMACAPDLMEQEKNFLEVLGRTARFRVGNGKLILSDAAAKDIMHLSAGS